MREPRFVVFGGGTGLSSLLVGLKRFSDEITAIVTMADDGGGSGKLRREKGILPPGDVRSCLVSLANTEPALEKLLNYRYDEGPLDGQNFGNLLIAALVDIYGNFEEAIKRLSQILKITGQVLPMTVEDVQLLAEFSDGTEKIGEASIPKYAFQNQTKIEKIHLIPEGAKGNRDCVESIRKADILVIGPGSLYTSLIPTILVQDIVREILDSKVPLVYIANIMTQKGETVDMTLLDHIQALEEHGLKNRITHLLLNTTEISKEAQDFYRKECSIQMVKYDENILEKIREKKIQIEEGDFLDERKGQVRHNGLMLSQRLLRISDELETL